MYCDILINVDHGCIPAATVVMKMDLHLDNFQLGTLGSMVFLGLTVGSAFATQVFQMVSEKKILIYSLILNIISVGFFCWTRQFWALNLSRFICGFAQVFTCIYM